MRILKKLSKLITFLSHRSPVKSQELQEPLQKIEIEELENVFLNLIAHFRELYQVADAGYAADRSGYGYFDLTNNEEDDGLSKEICLYYENWTFRISGVRKRDGETIFKLIISEYNGETKYSSHSSIDAIEKEIFGILERDTRVQA